MAKEENLNDTISRLFPSIPSVQSPNSTTSLQPNIANQPQFQTRSLQEHGIPNFVTEDITKSIDTRPIQANNSKNSK
ncbi:hypothetical protein [Anaerospora sp.]|uniref:hypothetical protein n=1 Tax=Anaerospora sp. TaxID=1960278 RepID=UPI002897C6D1|nr:hypothetical protein [Anaerospora sp.]